MRASPAFAKRVGGEVFVADAGEYRTYVVGLGANLGDVLSTLRAAAAQLAMLDDVELCARSLIYRSKAMGPPQPDFLNAAVRLNSRLAPLSLLEHLHALEAALGRERRIRWGPRTIDLDILWSDKGHRCPKLNIPHLRLKERWWALRPLLDVAPELQPFYGAALSALGATPIPLCSL